MKYFWTILLSLTFVTGFGQDAGRWDKSKINMTEDENSNRKYIDMWLADGKQILKNGVGWCYTFFKKDSMIYQIKDSIFNGPYKRYQLTDKKYILMETGQYKNGQPIGTFIFTDSANGHKITTTYLPNKKIEDYVIWNENFKVTEISHFVNGKIEGMLKLFDDNGVLTKEINNKDGNRYGDYKEYYSNGLIKINGRYTQVDTTATVQGYDDIGREVTRQSTWKVPRQTGKWTYYDEAGKIIRTEIFKD